MSDVKLKAVFDLYALSENERIRWIANWCMERKGEVVGFMVETSQKRDRYIEKMKRWFPTIHVTDIHADCPTPGIIMIKVKHVDSSPNN